MTRSRWLALLAVAALVATACQPGGTGGKPSKLTIAAVQGNESIGLKALAPDYEKKTGIKLEIVESPYDQLYEKLVNSFKANDATFDLVMMDDPWMPKFGTDGSLQELGQFGITRDPDIAPVIYDVGTWPPPRGAAPPSEKGKPQQLLGITIVGNVQMFMYRSDMSEAPKTYDDVLANAKKFNQPGKMAGYAIRGKAGNPIVADFLPILWSFGGDVFDENWKVVFDSPDSVAAIKFLVEDLKAVGQASPDTSDAADRARLMAIGEAYQSSVWPGEVAGIVGDPAVSKVIGKVGFIPIPAGKSGKGFGMMGNWLLGIPKGSKNGQAAADFIKWMTEKETQKTYAEKGGIPSRTSILTDPALNEKNPYFKPLADSLQVPPNWRPRTDQWNAVENILGTELNAALAGQKTAEAAAKAAADQIRTLMTGAGYPSQ
ncbi:MAG TPA: extracellular solute-binding protein [Candidatus Limnocylindrales bacterium]|nr:extracellular solute-binding protein [Candidatus Limnocylindrales bacterium]